MPGSDRLDLDDRPRRSGRGCLAGVFVLLVLAGLYAAAAVYLGDRVPADSRVGGVSVGGMTRSEAQAALERELRDDEARDLRITGAGRSVTIAPKAAGLAYDYEGSLDGLTGFTLNPADLLAHVRGGVTRPIERTVDEDTLRSAVAAGVKKLEKPAVEGSVRLSGTEVTVKNSKEGVAADEDAVTDAVDEGWPGTLEYAAPTSPVAPKLAQAEIDRVVGTELSPLVSGPVTIATTDPTAKQGARDLTFPVSAAALAPAVTVSQEESALSVAVDKKKVTAAVLAAGKESGLLREARDAGVVATGSGSFKVTPSQTGLGLVEDSIADPVVAAMHEEGPARRAEVSSRTTEPRLTTAEAKATLPKERISTFTTILPDNPTRTHNIETAARALNGTYVAPGETFSLNGLLGERTAAKGYNEAPVIMNGRLRNDYGGGISQLSTTLFNAVFFSGAKIEEFHPHSFYISRYPEGREATISWPDVDNRFTNDTGAGILITAGVKGDQVTVTFDGRKKWDVEAVKGPRRAVVQPKTIVDDEADCVPQSPSAGFDVTVQRVFSEGGREVRRESFTTQYIPEDEVRCTHPAAG